MEKNRIRDKHPGSATLPPAIYYLTKGAELGGIEEVPHILDDILALLRGLLRLASQEQRTRRGHLAKENTSQICRVSDSYSFDMDPIQHYRLSFNDQKLKIYR
jgi:hypothetical protein